MQNRWWIYQREQFPILKNSLLIGTLSLSSICYSVLLRSRLGDDLPTYPMPLIGMVLIAFVTLVLFFLQVQIVREFRGADQKKRSSLSRPVAEGLISLKELGMLGIAIGAVQLGLNLALGLTLVLPLLVLWAYLLLYRQQFFAEDWLNAHPAIRTVTTILALPIASFYATACDWITVRLLAPPGLIWLLLLGWIGGMAIALASNLQMSRDRLSSGEFFTVQWGRQTSLRTWVGLIWVLALVHLLAAMYVGFTPLNLGLVLVLLTGAIVVVWQCFVKPTPAWNQRLEAIAQLWLLVAYLAVGPLALIAQRF